MDDKIRQTLLEKKKNDKKVSVGGFGDSPVCAILLKILSQQSSMPQRESCCNRSRLEEGRLASKQLHSYQQQQLRMSQVVRRLSAVKKTLHCQEKLMRKARMRRIAKKT